MVQWVTDFPFFKLNTTFSMNLRSSDYILDVGVMMNAKTTPFTKEQLETIIAQYPTPFHIYDAKGIMDNMRAFLDAFSWAPGFKQYFAVKATPNPYIMKMMKEIGIGADCSSMAELILSEKVGITGDDIMFSSKSTKKRWTLGPSSI